MTVVTMGRCWLSSEKVAFVAKALAMVALRRARARGELVTRVYRCPACDGWHVTSRGRRR